MCDLLAMQHRIYPREVSSTGRIQIGIDMGTGRGIGIDIGIGIGIGTDIGIGMGIGICFRGL